MKLHIIYFFILFNYFFANEKKFVFIITSYNNSNWIYKNLDSTFQQNYANYRVIYVDDCSSDNSLDIIEKYLTEKSIDKDKFIFIKNNIRNYKAYNLSLAVDICEDNEIIVILDGDDWLSDSGVLSNLNTIFSENDIYVSYGSYVDLDINLKSKCPISLGFPKNTNFRKEYGMIPGHPFAAYARLFKLVKKSDLIYQNSFIKMASDVAFIIPICEMAGINKIYFNKRINYIHNRQNPINDHKVDNKFQFKINNYIRGKKPYQKVILLE